MAFDASTPSGHSVRLDTIPESGEAGSGPTPVEMLLASLATCSAMDVVSILQKQRQSVESYRVEIEGERVPPGSWPRPFTSITIRHILRGEDLREELVRRAVQLSDEKYCSVLATVRASPPIASEWAIETTAPGPG